jgi:phenylpropionate dioxygenase-like ring-hydroxylating dioxygenase large terminal subunit
LKEIPLFLRNAWYVAAWDHEVTRELSAVRIIGDSIVLYRTEAGEPVALEDACPHRKLPLSMGRIVGDEVECGYHGMVFDRAGSCTRIPGVKRVPPSVCVRGYPAVSLYGLIWIWMGDPAHARAEKIVGVDHWTDPAWGRNQGGSMTVDCNYLYVTDNLLDPSHVAWVHRTSFGNEDRVDEPVQTEVSAAGVVAARWLHDVEVAPFYAPLVAFAGRCDRLQHYEVRFPSHAIIRALFVPAGSGGHGRPIHEKALMMDSYNFITPIDADHSRYFWFQMRNFSPGDQRISTIMDDAVRDAFAEDRVILNAVHRGFANQATPNIDLAIDRAPLQFRRALNGLIAAERAVA